MSARDGYELCAVGGAEEGKPIEGHSCRNRPSHLTNLQLTDSKAKQNPVQLLCHRLETIQVIICSELMARRRIKTSKLLSAAIFFGAIVIAVGLAIGIAIGVGNRDCGGVQLNRACPKTASDGGCPEVHASQNSPDKETEKKHGNVLFSSQPGQYRYAAVAADATVCSRIGTDVLARKRGSAVDAAIASLFCMGVLNMHSMGIGGGFFATIYDSKSKTVFALDARETAPGAAQENMYGGNRRLSMLGPLSIAVPGEVKGYWDMYRKYGKLPWEDLIRPTVDLCENGFPVTGALARAIKLKSQSGTLSDDLRQVLTDPTTGKLAQEGTVLKFPRLAKTLRILAEKGGDYFYKGALAEDIALDIQERGGIITQDDLAGYIAKWKTPVSLSLEDGSTVYSLPAPSGGPVLSLILNILEGYNFTKESVSSEENTVLTYHRIAEAMKFAYAKRTNLGDEDFVDVRELQTNMTSREYGENLRQQISDYMTFDPAYYGPTFYDELKPGTAHLSLMDVDGNAVSVTSTVNLYFGSGVMGSRTGIIFNDEMDDFSSPNVTNAFGIKPSPANFIKPGKRPLSSMCPAIILKGDNTVSMVTGAAGGAKITTATALVILRALRFGQDLKTATDSGRFHHQLLPNELRVEEGGFPQAILDGLKTKGHVIATTNPRGSVVQTVLATDPDVLQGISDDRKSAKADGY